MTDDVLSERELAELERLADAATPDATGAMSTIAAYKLAEKACTAVPALIASLRAARAKCKALRAEVAAANRELERWRHGVPIEGDYVCPNALEVSNLRAELQAARSVIDQLHLVCDGDAADKEIARLRSHVAELESQLALVRKQRDDMLAIATRQEPVIEAAKHYTAMQRHCSPDYEDTLMRAVDALAASEKSHEGEP